MTDQKLNGKDVFVLKRIQGFPYAYDTPEGRQRIFLMQLTGQYSGDNEETTSPMIGFISHDQVMEFATKVLEWGSETFGIGVRTEVIDVTDQQAPAPARTGQYL